EWSDRLSPDLKSRLESAVERARKAHRGEDMGEVRAATEELTAAYQEAGRSLYSQTQGEGAAAEPQPDTSQPGPQQGERPGSKPEDVVEADYEIVDETKKT
ncbi:MAG: molecular chaperone DnaK, partial [Gemmatimonadaceae bacterium]